MVHKPVAVQVGKDLEEVYWRPGNGAAFLDLVQQLTGHPLSADAWVAQLQEPVASLLQHEEQDYKDAVQKGPKLKPGMAVILLTSRPALSGVWTSSLPL